MTKRNIEWNDNKLHGFMKRNWHLEGKDYEPWLNIRDKPSMGRVTRIYSHKTQRIHHFLSDNETRMFYLLAWEDAVTDIREFYPLINMEEVIKDKKGIDFSKFVDKETGTQYVFTTTFLVTYKNNENKDCFLARSVKSADELEKKYIIEKFEMERRYWESKGIDWGIITQKDIAVVKAKNIEWVYSAIEDREVIDNTKYDLSKMLLQNLEGSFNSVRTITTLLDDNYNLESGTGLFLFKHLIATKAIVVDMNEKINVNLPANEVILELKGKEGYKVC